MASVNLTVPKNILETSLGLTQVRSFRLNFGLGGPGIAKTIS
ncbi:hypothetical protein MFUM_1010001 [Methylacidiphilum fumariolicum SolV]|uniref:Uncharacterized protein n=2 Tax=Candidatus Methylacidiphilum fumarolicum TaxID=591154 RepID=I0JVB5_METFB|nr:conserved protein of unknown function [Candidatus Methylacidiphilum fumarolicum]CCG91184.1 hypothetical protein MFUM_1010001 [Methylacidiphilum fumariolicum SolV]